MTIVTLAAWLCTSNEVAGATAPLGASHGAAIRQELAPRRLCAFRCLVPATYEVEYTGTETLSTLRPVPSQPFYQAGRKLYIKLKWDLRVFRRKDTNAVFGRQVKVSGLVDLTIPDSPTLDCTAPYSLDAASAKYELDNTSVSIVAGRKALVWTLGIPKAGAACNDSNPTPLFTNQGFQTQYERAAQPHFTKPCGPINKSGGTWSKVFDFGSRASPAELSTVGLGQMDATIRSKVVIKGVKCGKGVVFG